MTVPKSPYLGLLTKFALRMRGTMWYISMVKSNHILVFFHTHISYSICNFYGATINHKGRFLLIPLQNMIALCGPLKNENGFGLKRNDSIPWANRLQRATPTTERRTWVHRAKIHASQGISRGRVERTMPTPPPFSAATIFCMWGRTMDAIRRARNQVNRFRGFGDPGRPKMTIPID